MAASPIAESQLVAGVDDPRREVAFFGVGAFWFFFELRSAPDWFGSAATVDGDAYLVAPYEEADVTGRRGE